MIKKLIFAAATLSLFIGNASAEPILYQYTTGTASQGGNVPELSALFDGLSVSGTFTYDADNPLTVTLPNGAEIYVGAVSNWTGSVGSNSFFDADGSGFALVGDDTFDFGGTLSDIFLMSMGAPGTGAASGFSAGGFTLDNVRMFWIENLLPTVPDFISGSGLLDPLPSFAGRLALDFGTIERNGRTLPVNVFFDDLIVARVPVPEPGSLGLLALGFIAFGLVRRRQTKTAFE